jgi:xylulokinase
MSTLAILAIDLGTSGAKAALVSIQGAILAGTVEAIRTHTLPEGGAEQDPAEWWAAICTAARRALAQKPAGVQVAGICATAQWSGTVAVGREGEVLAPALIWMDQRGAPYVRRLVSGWPRVQGYGAGKLWTWLRRSGGIPGLSGKDSIAHILYLKHEQPDVHAAAAKFLEPKDYINFKLTGHCAATVESITLHWVTDNRDVHNVRYDDQLLHMAGLDRAQLPDLCRSTDVLGTLTPAAATDLGLDPGVPVVAGTPDLHSAAIGSGAVADYAVHACIGTSAWMSCHVPFKKADVVHNMASLPSALPGRYLLINEQEVAGACLIMLRDHLFFDQDELASGPLPPDFFARLETLAAAAPVGSNSTLFTPWLNGERSPVDDATVRGGWHNLSVRTRRSDLVRAVYEGVAFNMRWLLGPVESFIQRPVERINLVGGGARSALWCRILADILKRPIQQVADPVYTNARGAGFLGAVGLGYLSVDALEEQTPVAAVYEPDAQAEACYDELFGEFVELYRKNRAIYSRLNRRR